MAERRMREDSYEHTDAPVSATAKSAAHTPRAKGPISRIEIEVADNGGFTARVYRRNPSKGRGALMSLMEPQTVTFAHYYGLDEWLGKELGVDRGDGETAEEDATEAAEAARAAKPKPKKKAAAKPPAAEAAAGADDDEGAEGAGDDDDEDVDAGAEDADEEAEPGSGDDAD